MLGGVGHEGRVVGGAEKLVVGCEGALLGFEGDWHAVDFVVGEFLSWDGVWIFVALFLDFCVVEGS